MSIMLSAPNARIWPRGTALVVAMIGQCVSHGSDVWKQRQGVGVVVSEYVETGNATQAARLAGYSPRTSAQLR